MKNDHILHVEDLLITEANPFVPLNILEQVYNFLTGIPTDTKVSVKWDGCPAFVVGKNPENNRFFVGTKSVFSGKKVNYCHADIMENYPDNKGLQAVLMELYDMFYYYDFPNVLQGDLLWSGYHTTGDQIEFQPNTLRYVVPNNSKLFNDIQKCQLGCVFHTTYTGITLEDMEAHFYAPIPNKSNSQVYIFDSKVEPECLWDLNLTSVILCMRERAQNLLKLESTLNWMKPNGATGAYFQEYINFCIRENRTPHSFDFLQYRTHKFDYHILNLKTKKGKEKATWWRNLYLEGLKNTIGNNSFGDIFDYYLDLIRLKNMLIRELDQVAVKDIKIYLPDGTTPCGHEGYVVSTLGHTVKLVDRYCFSRANFERWSE